MFSDVVVIGGRAQIVTDALFAPLPAWYVRAAAQDGAIAAAAQAGTGTCQVVDSLGHRWDSGDVAFGVQCVGIQPHPQGWEVTWMRAPIGATYGRVVLDRDLRPIAPSIQQFPAPYGNTSQGFLDVDLGGVPVMTDQHRTVVCGPLTIGLPTTRGDWTIGQDWDGNRIVAWHAPSQCAYEVWRGGTQTPSHLAIEADGTAVVAIANTAILVPSTAFVPWTPWTQPAPAIPDLGRVDQPLWVAPFKAWTDRADYGQTETPTNAMVLDLADPSTAPSRYAFLWEGIPQTPDTPSRALDARFIGYYLSCEGGGSNTEALAAFTHAVPLVTSAAIARQRPVYVTLDGVVDPDRWLAFLAQYFPARAGLEVVPMPELYPIVGLTEDATVDAWDRLLGTLGARGYRVAAATTLYTQSDFWPLSLVVALQPRIADLVRVHRLHLIAPFAVGRPSGVVSYPDVLGPILEQWGRASTSAATPPLLVLPPVAAPQPSPTPTPEAPAQPDVPAPEARTEVVMIGNQRVLMTPTEAAATRAAQRAGVEAFNPALPKGFPR